MENDMAKKFKFKKHSKLKRYNSFREILDAAVASRPDHLAYRYKKGDGIEDVTVKEFYDEVEALGASLARLGAKKSHIALIGENSYNWIVCLYSVIMSDSVLVPLDKELPAEQIVNLINEGDVDYILCDGAKELIIKSEIESIGRVKNVICFDRDEDDGIFLSYRRIIEEGKLLDKSEYKASRSEPKEMKELVFTSGTTGVSKGVMLSEFNLISEVYGGLANTRPMDVSLSVLPYNHTYEASCDLLISHITGTVVCINDSLRNVKQNMKLFRPSYMFLVPLFAETFMSAIIKSVDKKGKTKSFNAARKITRALRKVGIDLRRVFFASIHKEFGGRLRRLVFGGAPLREEAGRFFDDLGFTVTGAYGITECSPGVSINDDKRTNVSAGKPIPCIEVKIESETDEIPKGAKTGIGEIMVKGDIVMLGYYKRPDLTEEVMFDGWFATGDYGYLTKDGTLMITGRKKNIIVLQNGKNIYPEEIEEYICSVPYIDEAIVNAIRDENGMESGLCAEIYMSTPNENADKIMEDVREALKSLPSYKQIRSITAREEPFPKTSTKKIKRYA